MRLISHGLELELVPVGGSAHQDFSTVEAIITVPGFSGRIEASIERDDLMRFARELENLDVTLTPGDTAALQPIEHELSIVLTMRGGGRIDGEYRFEGGMSDGIHPTVLSGSFVLDQSFLPALRRQTANMLESLGEQPSL